MGSPIFDRLSAAQWVALDIVVTAGALFVAIINLHGSRGPHAAAKDGALSLVIVIVGAAPVALRRIWPAPALALVTTAAVILTIIGQSPFAIDPMIGMASYMVATHFERPVALIGLVVTESVLAAAAFVAIAKGASASYVMHSVLTSGALWFIGDSVRARRLYVAGLADQVEHHRVTEAEQRRQALRDERVRIARELHDVVAHSLTVMTVQAAVGRRVMGTRPDEAANALEAVETIGRTAQDELRLILGLLRDDEHERADLAPAPGLADLSALVDKVRAAGVPVALHVSGVERSLSPALELSLYRIAQEALTNVVKHAGKARTSVELVFGCSEVRLEVIDDGRSAGHRSEAAEPGTGSAPSLHHGIVGMHERVAAFGGVLVAEPALDTGFRVFASVPVPGPDDL